MKDLKNLCLDTNTKEKIQQIFKDCGCAPDCCDTGNAKEEACCEDNIIKDCCSESQDCCPESEKEEQDGCAPTETASCCDDNANTSCCESGESSCCGNETTSKVIKEGQATIDGKEVEVSSSDNNLVELAKKAKITIPAPCYFAKRKGGCCNACVVDVDGEQKFACATTPQDGMNITVNRLDLKALRKERILKYKERLKSGNPVVCSQS